MINQNPILWRSKEVENVFSFRVRNKPAKITHLVKSDEEALKLQNENNWKCIGCEARNGEPVWIVVDKQGLIRNTGSSNSFDFPIDLQSGGLYGMELQDRHLQQRETTWNKDTKAYFWLRNRISTMTALAAEKEKAALTKLKPGRFYFELKKIIEWLDGHGNPFDRSKVLFPLAWLAADPRRIDLINNLKIKSEIQAEKQKRFKELLSQEKEEENRAKRAETYKLSLFMKEYPTEPERRRAIIRVFNLNPDLFFGLTLDDDRALKIAIWLAAKQIQAISAIEKEQKAA